MDNLFIFLFQNHRRDYGRISDLNNHVPNYSFRDLVIIIVIFFIFYLIVKIGSNIEKRKKEEVDKEQKRIQTIRQEEFDKKEKARKIFEANKKKQFKVFSKALLKKDKERLKKKKLERKMQKEEEHLQQKDTLYYPFIFALCKDLIECKTHGDILEYFEKHTDQKKIEIISKCKESIVYMNRQIKIIDRESGYNESNKNILYMIKEVRKILKKDIKGIRALGEEFLPPYYDDIFGHYPNDYEEKEVYKIDKNFYEGDIPF